MDSWISLTGTLLIVVLILAGCYWATRKMGQMALPNRISRYMKVMDSIAVGQDRSLMIIQIGEKILLIASSPEGVQLLSALDREDLKEDPAAVSPGKTDEFKELLLKLRNRNKEQ